MSVAMAIGVGLVAAGLVFLLTGRGQSGPGPMRQVAKTVARSLIYVAAGLAFATVLTLLESSVARAATLALAAVGVGWAVLKVARNPEPGRRLMILGATVAASFVIAAVSGIFLGGEESRAEAPSPVESVVDPAGDCDCAPGLDIWTVGTYDDGSLLIGLGGSVPEGATIWLWPASDPFTPFALVRIEDAWTVESYALSGSDPSPIFVTDTSDGVRVQLGFEVGAFAATTSPGDRAPDSGYVGSDATLSSTDTEDRFQQGYGELSVAQRILAGALVRSQSKAGRFSYDVGISADPGVAHTGTLIIDSGLVEFALDASATRGRHIDRFARDGGGDACFDDADTCVEMWMSPYLALDDLYANGGSVEVITLVDREVIGRQAGCVAITVAGPTSLHEGEFCAFDDGTLAFVDDRSAGVVFVLTEAPDA